MRARALLALVIYTISYSCSFTAQGTNQHNVGNRYRQSFIDYPTGWCSFLAFNMFFNNMDTFNDNFVGLGEHPQHGACFAAIVTLYDLHGIVSLNLHLIKPLALRKLSW